MVFVYKCDEIIGHLDLSLPRVLAGCIGGDKNLSTGLLDNSDLRS